MSRNTTFNADINEITFGYTILGNTWDGFINSTEARETLAERKKKVFQKDIDDQVGRAESMSKDVKHWAKTNQYGIIKRAWWTARPNVLAKAVKKPVNSKKNPTDILLQFSDDKYLGISAKSTKGKNDIGFKNPGIGTLSNTLGIDLSSYVKPYESETIKKYNLPNSRKVRKKYIRSNPEIQKETVATGRKILNHLRNTLYNFYCSDCYNNEQMTEHIRNDWMDASTEIYPRYIKVTGKGTNGKYSSTIQDPLDNKKIKVLKRENKVLVSKVGTDSIGISVNSTKIMKIRFKYESEKLASTIKLSGDPWK